MAESTSAELRNPARDASGSYLRRRGRDFVVTLYGALRAIKLYPAEHTAVQKTLAELAQLADEIVDREHELDLRISGEFLFLNAIRLRLDLTNYASFGYWLRVCKAAGIGLSTANPFSLSDTHSCVSPIPGTSTWRTLSGNQTPGTISANLMTRYVRVPLKGEP